MQSIYEYKDYRKFLNDFYETNKKEKSFFSHRYFCNKANLSSPMHLKLVMTGERNLSHKSIKSFIKGLGLKSKEATYFENMVYFNQTKNSEEQLEYYNKLIKLSRPRSSSGSQLGNKHQKSLFSKWYYPLVYEFVGQKNFIENPTSIFKKLEGRVTIPEIKKTLSDLENAKLLVRDEENKLRQKNYRVETDDEIEDLLIRHYHKKMLEIAKEKIDAPLNEREFGFITVSSTPEKFKKLKMAIKEFLNESDQIMECEGKGTRLYQMNIQLFSLDSKSAT